MKVKYNFKDGSLVKAEDTVRLKLFSLENYDCKFLAIDVTTKENKRKTESSVMIPVQTKSDIDKLISELEALKEKL